MEDRLQTAKVLAKKAGKIIYENFGKIQAAADFHDIGPGSLIVEEAGGKVTGLHGEPLLYNQKIQGVIVSNGIAHESLVKIAGHLDL